METYTLDTCCLSDTTDYSLLKKKRDREVSISPNKSEFANTNANSTFNPTFNKTCYSPISINNDDTQSININNTSINSCCDIISKGLDITNNNVKASGKALKSQHKFVMSKIPINGIYKEWKVTIKNFTDWIGIGVCIKDNVMTNDMTFTNSSPNFSHSTFLLSLNGYMWNANNVKEDYFKLDDFPELFQNDVITIEYYPIDMKLTFKISNCNEIYTLTNVKSDIDIVPCIVLLDKEDEVEYDWK